MLLLSTWNPLFLHAQGLCGWLSQLWDSREPGAGGGDSGLHRDTTNTRSETPLKKQLLKEHQSLPLL